jgi:hypothetical protein
MKKSFVHTSRIAAEAKTTTAIIHKEREKRGVKYYEGVNFDADGSPILGDEIKQKKIQINRATSELSGAYGYLFNFVDYVCTHAPDLIEETEQLYHYVITCPWEKFLEITIGEEYKDQKKDLEEELYRLMHEAKPKLIPYKDGSTLYGQPFIVTLKSKTKKELSETALIKLKNIGKETTIGEIQVLFMKPLFVDVIKKQGNFINMPKNFYAMLVDKTRQITVRQMLDPDFRAFLFPDDYGPLFPSNTPNHQVAAYMRLYYYICLHDNQKGSYITLSLPDMVSHVIPRYANIVGGKLYIHDKKAVEDFLSIGLSIFASLETSANFIVTGVEGKDDELSIKILVKRRYKPNEKPNKDTLNMIRVKLKVESA